jgi:glycosyltransferase involved in cell wall biosynthesis
VASVSVIIPAYNAGGLLSKAVESATSQELESCEILVVDDGSTDGSIDNVRNTFKDVKIIESPRRGPGAARQLGTEHSSGEYVQYLDADDELIAGKLVRQVELLQTTGASIAYGDWVSVDAEKGHHERTTPSSPTADQELAIFSARLWCPPAAYLFTRSIVQRSGGWKPDLPNVQDVRFVFDCIHAGGQLARLDEVVAIHRTNQRKSWSKSNPLRFAQSCLKNAEEIEVVWRDEGRLDGPRVSALAETYAYVARAAIGRDEESYQSANRHLNQLAPNFVPRGPRALRLSSKLVGYPRALRLSSQYSRLKHLAGKLPVGHRVSA